MYKTVVAIGIMLALVFGMTACKEKSVPEKISDAAESAGEEVKEAAEDVGEAVKDTAEDAKDAVQDATN